MSINTYFRFVKQTGFFVENLAKESDTILFINYRKAAFEEFSTPSMAMRRANLRAQAITNRRVVELLSVFFSIPYTSTGVTLANRAKEMAKNIPTH